MLQEPLFCLCTQAIIVRELIVILGPNFGVSYMPAARPDYRVVTTLQDCIDLLVIIRGFCLVDVPSDDTLSILRHDSFLEGFRQTEVTGVAFLNIPPIFNALGALRCTYRASLNIPVSLLKDA